MENERRKQTRVPVTFEVVVTTQGQKIPIKTKNISLRGMLCPPDTHFTVGETCTVEITLNEEITITLEGKILRTRSDGTGIYFSGMDEDSFYHLKRLVQYNTTDPDAIDEELSSAGSGR